MDGKYGLRRLPTYLTSFTDGDLSVDDAVDQVLSGGFNVEYSKSLKMASFLSHIQAYL